MSLWNNGRTTRSLRKKYQPTGYWYCVIGRFSRWRISLLRRWWKKDLLCFPLTPKRFHISFNSSIRVSRMRSIYNSWLRMSMRWSSQASSIRCIWSWTRNIQVRTFARTLRKLWCRLFPNWYNETKTSQATTWRRSRLKPTLQSTSPCTKNNENNFTSQMIIKYTLTLCLYLCLCLFRCTHLCLLNK